MTTPPTELEQIAVWRPIPGWEMYEVSSLGQVRRYGKIRRLSSFRGYARLYLRDRTRNKSFFVHYLVLLAFVGPRPVGKECLHGPGGKSDNSVQNLRYGTHEENERDAVVRGEKARGERNGYSKLTDAIVREIRAQYKPRAKGRGRADLAKKYLVSLSCIDSVLSGSRWTHVI